MSLAKLALVQLKRKKLRTSILIVSVMLALSLLIGVNAGVDSLQTTYHDLVGASLGYTDLIIKSNTTNPTFDIQTVEPNLQTSAIAAYSVRVQYWAPFASADGRFNATSGAYLVGVNPQADEEFGAYKIVNGNYTALADALLAGNDFCVLGQSYARRLNLQPGETITLGYWNLTGPLPVQPTQTLNLTVAAIIQDLGRTYTFNSNNPTDFTRVDTGIIVNLNVAQRLFYLQPTQASNVYVHLQDLNQANNVQASLQTALGANFTVANLKVAMYENVQQNFGTYQTISYIIGGMALMIAAMLLLNTMLANVSERKREIGVMRSIGASKRQVFGTFIAELVPVALLGALASIPLSMVAAQLITSILPAININNMQASAITFSFSFFTVVSGLAVGIIITLAVGMVPAFLACKVKPIEALYPQMRSFRAPRKTRIVLPLTGLALTLLGLFLVQNGFSTTTSWFPTATALLGFAATLIGAILIASALLSPLAKAFSMLLKPFISQASVLVHRNIMLNFRRSVFSYGAFAVSIALLVAFGSLVSTAATYNVSVAKQQVGADMQVWVNAPTSFSEQLRAVEGVQHVAGVGYVSYGQSHMTFNDNHQANIMITGIASESFFDTIYQIHFSSTLNGMMPKQVYESIAQNEGKIILQDSLAKNLTAQVGDTITWSITNQTGTFERHLQVIATADFIAGRWETISNFAQGYYAAIVGFGDMQNFRHYLLVDNVDEFYVALQPEANIDQVVGKLSQACADAGYVPTIYTAKDTLAQTQAGFNQTETLALSVTAFFVLVGALGITAATVYNVAERKREINILTALGMDKRQNRIIIAGESLMLALVGTVVGFASGLGLSLFVVHVIPWWANMPAPGIIVSASTVMVAAIVIVVSAVLSTIYPATRVTK